MSDHTIPARDVADAVGLPLMWWDGDSIEWQSMHPSGETGTLDLSDPQTAFGVALRLDEWEAAHERLLGVDPDHSPTFATAVARGLMEREPEKMITRLQHIARDHRIRRALGWRVEVGTLAELERLKGRWVLTSPDGQVGQSRWGDTLANITDPTEALAAIDAALETP